MALRECISPILGFLEFTKMKRIQFIDSLKGFAIFCVLWGHVIQHFRNGDNAFANPVFEIIYSFHMPLFFLISGMFFKSSLELSFKDFLKKKMGELLLPCFVWAILIACWRLGISFYNDVEVDGMAVIKSLVVPFKWPFWFLKQLFLSYVLTYVFYKAFKKEWLVFFTLLAFVLIIPYGGMQRFLLPIFLTGILIRNNYDNIIPARANLLLYGSGAVFMIGLIFWKGTYTIYATEFPALVNWANLSFNFSNITISFFRFIEGISGSLFFLLVFYKFYRENGLAGFLEDIGRYSLSIYVLQFFLIEIDPFPDFQSHPFWIYNLVTSPLVSILVLLLSMGAISVVSRFQGVGEVFFGRSFRSIRSS